MYSDLTIALASANVQEARRTADRQAIVAEARRGSQSAGPSAVWGYFRHARRQTHQQAVRRTA
jgi:mevalonate pyrophosphate decarboxylase